MALVSILLSVLALICTAVGVLTTPIPVLGVVFSFGAAGIALGGILLAGRAETRAKDAGQPRDISRIALVLNVIALVPALLVALTCGLCNALCSTGNMQLQKDFRFNVGPGFGPDAGPGALPPPPRAAPPDPGAEPQPAPRAPGDPRPPEPSPPPRPAQPAEQRQEPTRLPPPPLPAGPGK